MFEGLIQWMQQPGTYNDIIVYMALGIVVMIGILAAMDGTNE